MSWASYVGMGMKSVAGFIQTAEAIQAGGVEAETDKYNAAVATMNSKVALQNASLVAEQGSSQASIQSEQDKAQVGATKANQGAGGVDVNSGSAVDTRVSEDELGKLDAMTIRSNATKEAFGYQVQSTNFQAQAEQDRVAASDALSSRWWTAGSTFLTTQGDVLMSSGGGMGGMMGGGGGGGGGG